MEDIKQTEKDDGRVPLFAFLLYMMGTIFGGMFVGLGLGHETPIIAGVFGMIAYAFARNFITTLGEETKFFTLFGIGALVFLLSLLFLGQYACGTWWALSPQCTAILEE